MQLAPSSARCVLASCSAEALRCRSGLLDSQLDWQRLGLLNVQGTQLQRGAGLSPAVTYQRCCVLFSHGCVLPVPGSPQPARPGPPPPSNAVTWVGCQSEGHLVRRDALASVPGQPEMLCPRASIAGNLGALVLLDPGFWAFQGCQCQDGYVLRHRGQLAFCSRGVRLPAWVIAVVVVLFVILSSGAGAILYLLLAGRAQVLQRASPPSARPPTLPVLHAAMLPSKPGRLACAAIVAALPGSAGAN